MYVSLLTAALVLELCAAAGTVLDCSLYNGAGCTSVGPFSLTFNGYSLTPNSQCRQNYQLSVTIPSGGSGFTCTFYMDNPEPNKYLYSIAESATATVADAYTSYIYGAGTYAMLGSSTTSSNIVNLFLNNIHASPFPNKNSQITYSFTNANLQVQGSQGGVPAATLASMFTPTSKTTYIGLNRRYADTLAQGSGVCRVYCTDY